MVEKSDIELPYFLTWAAKILNVKHLLRLIVYLKVSSALVNEKQIILST